MLMASSRLYATRTYLFHQPTDSSLFEGSGVLRMDDDVKEGQM
jgi:hypothetical protein